MARILNKIRLQMLAGKRDQLSAKVDLNNRYLEIARNTLNETMERRINRKAKQLNKQLNQLRERAISPKELAQSKLDAVQAKVDEKQRMPKKAVQQRFVRTYIHKGQQPAEQYRGKATKQLEQSMQHKLNRYVQRVEKAGEQISESALQQYQQTQADYEKSFASYQSHELQRMNRKLEQLQRQVQQSNQRIHDQVQRFSDALRKLGDETHQAMQHDDSVLEVNHLVMNFDGLRAVDDLSFRVREGEIFGLIGPNGAGKTTIFNCITQFNKPTEGRIYYRNANGEVVNLIQRKVHNVVKTGIVRTFQNVELIWELSVLENMLIAAHSLYHSRFVDSLLHTRRLRREEAVMRARAMDVLERLNLLDYKDMIPYGLPYGILKKIELARTLMVQPRLIILDEPAAGLNENETEELAQTIQRIREDYQCTIFLVEHDMGLVMDICDTVCAISFGKKLGIGSPYEIQTNPVVQEAYLGGSIMEDDDE